MGEKNKVNLILSRGLEFFFIGLSLFLLFFSCESESGVKVVIPFPSLLDGIDPLYQELNLEAPAYHLLYLDGSSNVVELALTQSMFPIEIETLRASNVPLLVKPPFPFEPVGSLLPWFRIEGQQLTLAGGWMAQSLMKNYSQESCAGLNYFKIVDKIEQTCLGLGSPHRCLDSQRFLRDLNANRINSYSIRLKEKGLFEVPPLSNWFPVSDFYGKHRGLFFYDEKESGYWLFEGVHCFLNPHWSEGGVGESTSWGVMMVSINPKKEPTFSLLECRLLKILAYDVAQ